MNPCTRTEPQTAIHVNLVFQTNAFKCKKCLPALENWQITALDIILVAPRKYFRLPAPWFLWWAQKSNQKRHSQLNSQQQGSRVGVVVRALVFHQCGPGSIPGPSVICGLSLLVLYSAPRGFSPGTPVFPSPQKPTFDLIWFDLFDLQSPQLVQHSCSARMIWDSNRVIIIIIIIITGVRHCSCPGRV